MKNRSVIAVVIAALAAIGDVRLSPGQPRIASPRVSDAAYVQGLLKQFNVPGVSIAIIKDFKVAASYAYGVVDAATGAPVTTDTMFQAASTSKPVAAMASLKAVQEGKFTLDQDVNTDPQIVEAADRGFHARASGHAASAHEPHVGNGRRL